jgi:hypothetical protein
MKILETITARINAMPDARPLLKGVLQFTTGGATWHIIVGDTAELHEGKHEKADATLVVAEGQPPELLEQVLTGAVDLQLAFYRKAIEIKGAQALIVTLFLKVLAKP